MNPGGEPTPIERALPELHLAAVAQQFRLEKFLKKEKARREKYFRLIERTTAMFTDAYGYPPPDRDLRDVVAIALTKDRTFLAFVINASGGNQAITATGGDDLVHAGAGAILCEYLTVNGKI